MNTGRASEALARVLVMACLILAPSGCKDTDTVTGVQPPTPNPGPPSYRIGGTVTIDRRFRLTTVTATSGGRQWTALIGSTGTYQFLGLPAGEFQVTVSGAPSWCGPRTKTVTIPPDATVNFLFIMC